MDSGTGFPRIFVRLALDPLTNVDAWRWHSLAYLLDSLEHGKSILHAYQFENYYEFFAEHPESHDAFNKGNGCPIV
uniref:Uncharacterized protein n=1 Tax=Candidatus Kentrum sp. LPFa TaxID=2126335 RepID=A0A450VWZ5_9GAMM|nr:MAG: hypothetical protein BECKLPF1236B_GA0070989_10075 [Candidatus Kentron sp. LPFa]